MKRRFTILTAALALLTFLAFPMGMRGQTTTLVSGSGSSGYSIPEGWTASGTVEGGSYLKFDNGTITSPAFAPHNGLSFTYTVATFGSGTNHPLTIRILNASTNAVIVEKTTATPTSSSYISTDSPLSLGDVAVAFKIQMYAPTGKGIRLRNYSVTGTPAGGQQLTTSDLALVDAPVELEFDLYDNSNDQTISYTTSSTGAVTVSQSNYITATVNANNTITVTPVAVTNGPQTITVNQAADDTYAAGSVTFTVDIEDSTPSTGTDVTFDATIDKGTSPLVKDGVRFVCSNGVLNNGSEYRLYKNSVTTFSVSEGTITKIVFTGVSGNPASGFASQTGWTTNGDNGTWTGNSQSVSFTASGAQVRATMIVVTVEGAATGEPTTITINVPDGFNTDLAEGTEAGTLTATVSANGDPIAGATVTWESSDTGIAEIDATTGAVTLVAVGTTTITASYAGVENEYLPSSKTYQLVVTNSNAPGSQAHPYTVAQARAAIDSNTGITNVYATGIVSDIVTAYDSGWGNVTFDMVDASGDEDYLRAYRCGGEQAANVAVGDVVVVYGSLKLHNQEIYEFEQGCEIVTLTPHQAQTYTLAVTSVSNATIEVFDATEPEEEGWGLLFEGEDEDQVTEGTPIALSVAATNGYVLTELMVNNVNHVDDITSGGIYTFNMLAENVTITVTAVQLVNINYSVNGTVAQSQVLPGSITLPTPADLTDDVLFAGWSMAPYDIANIMPAGTPVTVQGGETFYAVYGVTTTGGAATTVYQQVTAEPTSWEGEYLIVSEGTNDGNAFSVAFDGSLSDLDPTGDINKIDVTIDNGVIESSSAVDAATFIIEEVVESNQVVGYSIQSQSGKYIGRSTNTNGMDQSDQTVYTNTISYNNSYVNIIGSGNAYLRYNAASNTEKFRYYKSSTYTSQKAIQLFKKTSVTSSSTAYYTRVFLDETATAAMSITGPSYIPSGYYLDMDGKTLTNGMTADSLVIADGGQYMGNSVVATMQKVILPYSDQQGVNDKWYAISMPFTQSITPGQNNYMVDMVTDVTGEYTYDFYRFDNNYPGAEWRNFRLNGGFSMTAGQGYLYAHKHGIILNFTGTLNATTANVTSAAFSNGNTHWANYFFAGNPFSCQATILNHSDFFVMNAAGTDFVLDSDGILEPLQGAILYDANAAANYTITYVPGTGDTESIVDEGELFKALINLSVTKDRGEAIDVARVRFGEGLQIGKFQLDPNNTRIYFTQNGKEYAVVRSDAQGELPVGFHAGKNGTYTVNVETENVEMFYLHLVDNMTGADIDLLQTPSYTFEANSGDNANRFRLMFDANAIDEHNAEANFAYFNGSEWVVNNNGDATLQVVDMMGRVLSSETISGNANVNINQAAGIYMLRLVNGENVKVQKVVVR